MTPKEKAEELIHKFAKPIDALHKYPMCYETSKQCALIAVDEILEYIPKFEYGQGEKTTTMEYDYLQEVKQEIQNI